jgi:hypothetical protein
MVTVVDAVDVAPAHPFATTVTVDEPVYAAFHVTTPDDDIVPAVEGVRLQV